MKKSFYISFIIIILASILVQRIQVGSNVIVADNMLVELPYIIGDYSASDINLDDKIVTILDTDAYIFRNYLRDDGNSITLYIGYYGTKKGGRSEHNPEGCYPGAGWAISEAKKSTFLVDEDNLDKKVTLNTLMVNKSGTKQLVYHWYQTKGNKVLLTGIDQNIDRFIHRLFFNRNDGAFIRVSAEVYDDFKKTQKEIEDFIKLLFPLLNEYWPVEKEI